MNLVVLGNKTGLFCLFLNRQLHIKNNSLAVIVVDVILDSSRSFSKYQHQQLCLEA